MNSVIRRYNELLALEDKQGGGYVQGLSLWLDGIDNTRQGHSDTTQVWEDLSGNGYDFNARYNYLDLIWSENSFIPYQGSNGCEVEYRGAIMSGYTEFTIEVVFNPQANNGWLFNNRQTNSPANGFQAYVGSLKTLIDCYGSSNNSLGVPDTPNTFNEFQSLSMTYSGNTIKRYYKGNKLTEQTTWNNGEEITPAIITSSILSRTFYRVGAYSFQNGGQFEGDIYSIRIYPKALTDSEIAQNWQEDIRRFAQ